MPMSRMFTPSCEACADTADWAEWTSAAAKDMARAEGWHIKSNRYICPACWEAGKR